MVGMITLSIATSGHLQCAYCKQNRGRSGNEDNFIVDSCAGHSCGSGAGEWTVQNSG